MDENAARIIDQPQTAIQQIDEDDRQAYTIYQFHNCGTVYLDSLNTRNVAMENCGNNVPQVTYHRPRIVDCRKSDESSHSQSHVRVSNDLLPSTDPPRPPPRAERTHIPFSVHVILFSASLVVVSCLAFFVMVLKSWRLTLYK